MHATNGGSVTWPGCVSGTQRIVETKGETTMSSNESCPLCGHPVTSDELAAIHKRLEEEARARESASEARLRRELREEHEREMAAGAAAQAAEIARQREAMKADHDRALLKVRADANREKERLQKKTMELQRALDKKTANDLGDGQERDIEADLRNAFMPPAGEDAIQRVARGELGADILHDVRYKGATCGRIVYDSKNHKAWRTEFLTKLRHDKARHEATVAVLVTTAFPAGSRYFCVDGDVCIVHPDAVVHIAGVLRRSLIALHRQGLSMHARSGKMAALYKYLASGDFADQIRTAESLVGDLRRLDARERDAHDKVWKERERLITRTKAAIDEIDTQITGIMEREEGTTREAVAG